MLLCGWGQRFKLNFAINIDLCLNVAKTGAVEKEDKY